MLIILVVGELILLRRILTEFDVPSTNDDTIFALNTSSKSKHSLSIKILIKRDRIESHKEQFVST